MWWRSSQTHGGTTWSYARWYRHCQGPRHMNEEDFRWFQPLVIQVFPGEVHRAEKNHPLLFLLLSCAQLFCDPMDFSSPGSSAHCISQAIILDWVTISFSRGIFSAQGSNPCLLLGRWILYPLCHLGSPHPFLRCLNSCTTDPVSKIKCQLLIFALFNLGDSLFIFLITLATHQGIHLQLANLKTTYSFFFTFF